MRAIQKEVRTNHRASRAESERIIKILQRLYDDEPGNRRRLYELRESPEYELAYTEADPLVSIIIPTYTNVEALATRAIPSAIAQSYPNIEVIVVGDCAPPETAKSLAEFRDPRIVYYNRERRGPYPEAAYLLEFVKGGPPFNEALRRARGRWIAPFADDDSLRPLHVETLLRAAREGRHELCYGKFQKVAEDGRTEVGGEWPPELGRIGGQATIYHSGLRFFEQELAGALFRISGDKSLWRRMSNAGVRFGFVDEIVVDYSWDPRGATERSKL
ncbi:MAG: glycosyltransferase family 2 protein [Actinobacteria bacterium]|nr:glycosyltransferase family 2 protein [Actinomycetota bacterium]